MVRLLLGCTRWRVGLLNGRESDSWAGGRWRSGVGWMLLGGGRWRVLLLLLRNGRRRRWVRRRVVMRLRVIVRRTVITRRRRVGVRRTRSDRFHDEEKKQPCGQGWKVGLPVGGGEGADRRPQTADDRRGTRAQDGLSGAAHMSKASGRHSRAGHRREGRLKLRLRRRLCSEVAGEWIGGGLTDVWWCRRGAGQGNGHALRETQAQAQAQALRSQRQSYGMHARRGGTRCAATSRAKELISSLTPLARAASAVPAGRPRGATSDAIRSWMCVDSWSVSVTGASTADRCPVHRHFESAAKPIPPALPIFCHGI